MSFLTFCRKPLQLFGTPLKGMPRAKLRDVFKKGGLRATREEDQYWIDMYDPNGVLEGATVFQAGYVMATGRFAFARYTFPDTMDRRAANGLLRMMQVKYGQPTAQEGELHLGRMVVEWNLRGGMVIRLFSDWPVTTSYLVFEDPTARAAMRSEMAQEDLRRDRRRARMHNDVF